MRPPRTAAVIGFLGVELIALTWLATRDAPSVPHLLIGYGVAFTSYLILFPHLQRIRWSLGIWFLAGLLLRAPWIPSTPTLSDDVWRYLHDGRAQAAGVNPYRHPPSAPEARAYAGPELEQVNHPDLPTVYPPAAQLTFRIGTALGGTVLSWKLVLLVFDFAIALCIAGFLAGTGRSSMGAAIYLLHPLPVIEFAGNGHLDAVGIAALTAALLFVSRSAVGSAAGFAVSFATKYLTAPLFPFFARAVSKNVTFIVASIATLALLYIPFLDYSPVGSLGEFARSFEFNGLIYTAVAAVAGPTGARGILATLLLALLIYLWIAKAPAESAAFGWISAVLLLSPIVHPWYVVWLVPFLAWRAERWLLCWTGTVIVSYYVLTDWWAVGVWHLPVWVMLVEYVPVYVFLLLRKREI